MFRHLRHLFIQSIDLKPGTDTRGTIDSIKNNIEIKGYNVWILAAAAVIASIGLDQNSQAVIIGAMLISPLMSPILGVGLSIGINDRETLVKALESLSVATFAALLMSTLYFLITPFGDFNEQIRARTQPTLLDVGIGFFGGVAGIVSASRKDKTNAIPGVAIATALMPPICVAGYGLANQAWDIFFGAFYLFFLNAFFIALSTFLIVRFLKFPFKEFIDDQTRKRLSRWMVLFVILIMVPSGLLFYSVVNLEQLKRKTDLFLNAEMNNNGHLVLDQKIYRGEPDTLQVVVSGPFYDSTAVSDLRKSMQKPAYDLGNCYLELIQLSNDKMNAEEVGNLAERRAESRFEERFFNVLNSKNVELDDQQKTLASLRNQLDSVRQVATQLPLAEKEIQSIFPELKTIECAYAGDDSVALCLIKWDTKKLSITTQRRRNIQVEKFLKVRLQVDSVRVGM